MYWTTSCEAGLGFLYLISCSNWLLDSTPTCLTSTKGLPTTNLNWKTKTNWKDFHKLRKGHYITFEVIVCSPALISTIKTKTKWLLVRNMGVHRASLKPKQLFLCDCLLFWAFKKPLSDGKITAFQGFKNATWHKMQPQEREKLEVSVRPGQANPGAEEEKKNSVQALAPEFLF